MLGEQGAGIDNTVDLHANLHRFIVAAVAICDERGEKREDQ